MEHLRAWWCVVFLERWNRILRRVDEFGLCGTLPCDPLFSLDIVLPFSIIYFCHSQIFS